MAERLSEAKARRVYLILRDRILSNALAPGARLPTEVDLARFHRVSRVTVRRALAELSREQLIERRRASGTRVIYQPSSKPMTADIANVLATLVEMGERTTSKLLVVRLCAGRRPDRRGARRHGGRKAAALGARALDRRHAVLLSRRACAGPHRHDLFAARPGRNAAARAARTLRRQDRAGLAADQRGAGDAGDRARAESAGRLAADRAGARRLRQRRARRRASACALPARPLQSRNGSGAIERRRRPHLDAGRSRKASPQAQTNPNTNRGKPKCQTHQWNRRNFLQTSALGAVAPRPASSRRPPCCARRARPSRSASCIRCPARCPIRASRAASARRFAIEEINAAGGIKSLGGAKIEPVLGDAQSTPDGGNAEVEKMNAAGVCGDRRRLCERHLPRDDARPRRATTCPISSTSA